MKAAVLYSHKIKEYDLGHVLTGERFDNFWGLFQEKLANNPNIELFEPFYAGEEGLRLVHTDEYIKIIERLESHDPFDTPLSAGLVRAAKLLAGGRKACRKTPEPFIPGQDLPIKWEKERVIQ